MEATTLQEIFETVVTPATVVVGLLGNSLSIVVLMHKEIQLRKSFTRILIALAVFDIIFISSSGLIFSLTALSTYYQTHVYPRVVPLLLPVAQISMTASVYTTVVTCFDRYIAICRPALQGCFGRSEDTTSWILIVGTAVFSVLYNFSRFFEYETVAEVDEEWVASSAAVGDDYADYNATTVLENVTTWQVRPTKLRLHKDYIQYYILTANFIVMGICPCVIMVIFNVLVVRAVDEANKRRARISKRQQRNITVTSMLVTVVLVFLFCHSVKLVLSCYEVYELVTAPSPSEEDNLLEVADEDSFFDYDAYYGNATNATSHYYYQYYHNGSNFSVPANATSDGNGGGHEPPVWVGYLTSISHWLLILNSSCNIAIYLHKDPKFKAVFKSMVLRALRIDTNSSPGSPGGGDDLDDSRTGAPQQLRQLNNVNQVEGRAGSPFDGRRQVSTVLARATPSSSQMVKTPILAGAGGGGTAVTCVIHEEAKKTDGDVGSRNGRSKTTVTVVNGHVKGGTKANSQSSRDTGEDDGGGDAMEADKLLSGREETKVADTKC